MTTRRQFVQRSAAALATPLLPGQAFAQAWPSRPIRAMIPFAPGSSLDIVGRLVCDPLAGQLGQPVVIENRGGAGGTIGTGLVAKADPDGYSILIQASAHSAAPAAYPNISYDVAKDFIAIIPFGTFAQRHGGGAAKRHQDLEGARRQGQGRLGDLRFGRRRQRHALGRRADQSGRRLHRHPCAVPRRPRSADRGDDRPRRLHLDRHVGGAAADPRRQARRARRQHADALEGAARRADHDRGGPAGFRLFAPAKTPPAIVERLRAETEKALKNPNVVEKFATQGIEPMPLSPAAFDALIKKEIATNIALVKAAGLKFN
jgi:hypothetical protein